MNEIILLAEEILVTIFATNSTKQFLSLNAGMILGWMMIGLVLVALLFNILYGVYRIIGLVREYLKNRKKPVTAQGPEITFTHRNMRRRPERRPKKIVVKLSSNILGSPSRRIQDSFHNSSTINFINRDNSQNNFF